MQAKDFEKISEIIKQNCGISLGSEKVYLLESKISLLNQKFGFNSFQKVVDRIRLYDPVLLGELIEELTINETSFFRDAKPFTELINTIIPAILKDTNKKKIDVWCAASSSGQEPYSLAITLLESKFAEHHKFSITATDISSRILERAKNGLYTSFEISRGLSKNQLNKYFKKNGDFWQISNEIRDMVNFKIINLVESFAELDYYDIIYCRNVLIYFDPETKTRVIRNMARKLNTPGFLVLGSTETLVGIDVKLKMFDKLTSVYCNI